MFLTAKDFEYLDLADFRDHVIVVSRNLLQSFIIWKCLKILDSFLRIILSIIHCMFPINSTSEIIISCKMKLQCEDTYFFNVSLHLKWCIKLFVTMFALGQITEIQVLLFFTINMTLHMHHGANIVIQHLRTIPTL